MAVAAKTRKPKGLPRRPVVCDALRLTECCLPTPRCYRHSIQDPHTDLKPDCGVLSRCVVIAATSGHCSKAQQWADECVADNGKLTVAARQALVDAGLSPPESSRGREDTPSPTSSSIGSEVAFINSLVDVPLHSDGKGSQAHRSNDDKAKLAARKAAVGARYTGTIKDFVPERFGHIVCPALHDLFQKDVFLSKWDNPQLLTKGQRVSFVLHISPTGMPQASKIKLVRPYE